MPMRNALCSYLFLVELIFFQISEYDMQIWEKAVESEENKHNCISSFVGQESLPKSEMIDLDLVKGKFDLHRLVCQNVIYT